MRLPSIWFTIDHAAAIGGLDLDVTKYLLGPATRICCFSYFVEDFLRGTQKFSVIVLPILFDCFSILVNSVVRAVAFL